MFSQWWKLPSTDRFLNNIISSLKHGKNVILWLPLGIDEGYINLMRDLVKTKTDYVWNKITPDSKNPTDFLFDHFNIQYVKGAEKRIKDLFRHQSLEGQIVYIDLKSEIKLDSWIEFLVNYQHQLQNIEPIYRCLFILPAIGILEKKLPQVDICLTVFKYQNIVSELDLELFFASSTETNNSLPEIVRKTYLSILTQLSNDDIRFSNYLLDQSPESIFNPKTIITEYGRELGWMQTRFKDIKDLNNYETDNLLAKGILSFINRKLSYHSAFLCVHNKDNELKRRIWTGQVKVLFPFVEIIRFQILRCLKGVVHVPHEKKLTTGHTVIENYFDLELGDISFQLNKKYNSNKYSVEKDILNLVNILKVIRDSISHLDVVDFNIINDDLLNRYEDILQH